MKSATTYALLAAGLVVCAAQPAHAIPAFARKHNVACNTCHIAYPLLNSAGRRFREAGYRFAGTDGKVDDSIQGNQTIGPGLTVDPSFPISARAQGWLFESTNDKHASIHPVTSVSLLVAGLWAKQGSAFIEAGAEDEGDWTPDVAAQVGYHPSRFLSVLAGTRGPFYSDPFNTFRDPLSFTARSSVDRIADDDVGRPTLEAWGRVASLYYAGALTVTADNPLGTRPRLGFGRLAVDVTDRSMVGAFILGGTRITAGGEPKRTLLRAGIDWNLAVADLYVIGIASVLREETAAGHDLDLTGALELFYPIPVDDERALIPLLRAEADTFGDRDQTEVGLVGGLYFQFLQNARIGAEGRGDLKAQVSGDRTWGAGLNADVAF